jgi:TonB family protein
MTPCGSGIVLLSLLISEEGRVEQVRVLRSANPLFEEIATGCAKEWTYAPALLGGRPVRVWKTETVTFRF